MSLPGRPQGLAPADYTPRAVSDVLAPEQVEQIRAGVLSWDEQAEALQRQRRNLVEYLRRAGMVWDGVGWLLGTTGEGARQRYGK